MMNVLSAFDLWLNIGGSLSNDIVLKNEEYSAIDYFSTLSNMRKMCTPLQASKVVQVANGYVCMGYNPASFPKITCILSDELVEIDYKHFMIHSYVQFP